MIESVYFTSRGFIQIKLTDQWRIYESSGDTPGIWVKSPKGVTFLIDIEKDFVNNNPNVSLLYLRNGLSIASLPEHVLLIAQRLTDVHFIYGTELEIRNAFVEKMKLEIKKDDGERTVKEGDPIIIGKTLYDELRSQIRFLFARLIPLTEEWRKKLVKIVDKIEEENTNEC